ncbi:MAG: cytidylate kinase family protein [Candidatus Diapherotrites archaeon]
MKRNVFVCGLAGSGKSSLADDIGKSRKLKVVHTSRLLREVAGFESKSEGFWEKDKGMQFLQARMRNYELDKKLDRKLKELASKGGKVMDSWTMPWLWKEPKDVRIWLETSSEARARRIAKRDKIEFERALKMVNERDDKNVRLYYSMYGMQLGKDFTPFDLILKTDSFNQKQVFEIVDAFVKVALKAKK